MAEVIVRGGTVVDHSGSRRADVIVDDGIIIAVGPDLDVPAGATVLDAGGCVVAPGLVDLHTHLRQPGGEEAETVETAARAAALGGYTAVVAMPNTNPPIDSAAVALEVLSLGRSALCQVAVAGAITVGRAGQKLAPMGELAALGVRLFTDDGTGVQDAGVMRRALEYAHGLGVTLGQHCEDGQLAAGGHMHEGAWSSRLGVPGMPAEAEELMVARDIMLARLTGGRVHFLHLSTAGSVALVAAAKAEGLPVTAEVAPHHLALTDAELAGYDAVFKVNPPLRTDADVAAVRAGCAAGTIDAVATDHAPHPAEAKEGPLDAAAPGMLGLETAVAVTLEALGANGSAPAMAVGDILGLLSWRPAVIAGLSVDHGGDQGGPVAVGLPGNLCVIDQSERWEVDPDRLASRSRNTPWSGRTLTGKVRHTVYRGEPVVIDSDANDEKETAMMSRVFPGRTTPALLVLADGEVFEGEAIGATAAGGVATGELVFNTVLSGYQEVITDPSYAGQVIAFTYPHIGNYGVTADDDEAARPWCRGVVVRDLTNRPSNWRATGSLEDMLVRHGIPGIAGVDTRRLTRHLRDDGAMGCAFGTAPEATLAQAAAAEAGTSGRDLVSEVTTASPYTRGSGPLHVVAYDFGVKRTMVRGLEENARITVVPADFPASEALALAPDGVFLSNGPGDPAALPTQAGIVAELLGRVPVFGICLGHQLLATALGGTTFKLPFGHHGGNHPVKHLASGHVEITSQNHNYAVDAASLGRSGAEATEITHLNLNDGVVEGFRCTGIPAFSVQYHPEAGPGPHDARYLFAQFRDLMTGVPA